jgi:hypothetical protein
MARRKSARHARRVRVIRKHAVNLNLQVFGITKAGTSLDLEIYQEGEKLGHLTIGRGSINWRGGKHKKVKHFRWPDFAERMNELAYGPPRTRPEA